MSRRTDIVPRWPGCGSYRVGICGEDAMREAVAVGPVWGLWEGWECHLGVRDDAGVEPVLR